MSFYGLKIKFKRHRGNVLRILNKFSNPKSWHIPKKYKSFVQSKNEHDPIIKSIFVPSTVVGTVLLGTVPTCKNELPLTDSHGEFSTNRNYILIPKTHQEQ